MAGKVVVSTLNNDTGVLATQNGMTGIAKAWASYNGATQTVNGSFNISSIVRNSTSTYTYNFTTAMPNANYAIAGIAGKLAGESAQMLTPQSTPTTTSFQLKAWVWNVSLDDPTYVGVAVFAS